MIKRNVKGQALVETALVLLLLLIILLGIAEFSRAWYTKNSLKNAVRQGARVAAVTPGISSFSGVLCSGTPTDADDVAVHTAVCSQPGVSPTTSVSLIVDMATAPPTTVLNSGDTATVQATTTFNFVIGNSPWPWSKSMSITTAASMRYE
jgi:hypothetical protein